MDALTKICRTCGRTLDIKRFAVRYATCKECLEARYNLSDPDNRKREYERHRAYYAATREYHLQHKKQWYIDNKERLKAVRLHRYNTDINFKMRTLLRGRLNSKLRNAAHESAVDELGCTLQELKLYLESKFQPGMTWSNWSRYGWHIDHIEALAKFDLSDPKQLKVACHHTNLQPLWAGDNLSKGKK